MPKIFQHVPHPHIERRKTQHPPRVADQLPTGGPLTRFNTFLALKITAIVGTMWCAYAFALLAFVSLPDDQGRDLTDDHMDRADVSPARAAVDHHRGSERAERRRRSRAQATYEDADAVLHTALEIQKHMEAQDLEIEKIISAISQLRPT